MKKQLCKCGNMMDIRLRTVIFSNRVEIENVPIFSCGYCSRSEVFPDVKTELTGLIHKLGDNPEKQQLYFNEVNEIAHLMCAVTEEDEEEVSVEWIVEERVNQLLDMLILARSLSDDEWMNEICGRLRQIQVIGTYAGN